MIGPYSAINDGTIKYLGNNIFRPIDNVAHTPFSLDLISSRVGQMHSDKMWSCISRINHRINMSTNEYFESLNALFTILPLTTRMISSPGAVYGKEAISYTTDTSPITVEWFDLERSVFLAESSQIYLELSLLQSGVDHVYAIYNSFRKEKADITHLSEFHHIEYEGKVKQSENIIIAKNLVKKIILDLLKYNSSDLAYFLKEKKLYELEEMANKLDKVPMLKFSEVLEILYKETKNERYKKFTQNGTFGSWEEVLLTEVLKNMVIVTEFPLLEVPFYHDVVDGSEPKTANNADFIWPGYREFLGSGQRVRDTNALEEKARIFDLPRNDYRPYLQSRELSGYTITSGFGLGWERLLHGLLDMPNIWSAVQFPRGHVELIP